MVSIAEQYGFFWETLWNHPNNKELRGRRHDPTVLLLDDEVFVPDRTPKDYVRPTGARHTFKVKNVPAKLNVRLLDEAGHPRSGLAFVLAVDGVETPGTTDGDGWVRASLTPTAIAGTLHLVATDETFQLDLGHLDPVDTVRGAQARLAQLGAFHGAVDGETSDVFAAALRAFQTSQGLRATGELDASTQAALRAAHQG